MLVTDLLDTNKLTEYIEAGFINVRKHPALPLRIFNYTPKAQFERFWPHEVCQCRGLIVDEDDVVVSRSQYKFFNLGQDSTIMVEDSWKSEEVSITSDYLAHVAAYHGNPLTITRKMDGQMGVLWNYGEQWGIATRGSFESEGAAFATERFQKFVKYGAAKEFIPKGWTLIFEIIAKHLRIVIPYEWEGLCLLTAVNNETGEEMSYEELHAMWTNLNSYSKTIDANGISIPGKPWCRIVEKFDIDLDTAAADEDKEEEGYVVSVARPGLHPLKVKIKLAEYCRLHRVLTNLTPQMIWKELATPMTPFLAVESRMDFKTGEEVRALPVPPEFRLWVHQWQRGMTNAFHELLLKAIEANRDLKKWEWGVSDMKPLGNPTSKFKHDAERKAWLMSPNGGSVPKDIASVAMLLHSGKIVEAYEALWDQVRPFGREDKFFVEGAGE